MLSRTRLALAVAPWTLVVAAILIAVLAVGAAPAAADVGWRGISLPYTTPGDPESKVLTYTPTGRLYFQETRVGASGTPRIAVRPHGGDFTDVTALPPGQQSFSAGLAFSSAGDGVWFNAATSSSFSDRDLFAGPGPTDASTAFGTQQTIGNGRGEGLAVNDSGAALASWRRATDGKLVYAERSAGSASTFGAETQPTGTPDVGVGSSPFTFSITWPIMDADGGGVIVHSSPGTAPYALSMASRSDGSTSFGSDVAFTTGSSVMAPSFASNRAGDAVIVWDDTSSPSDFEHTFKAYYRPHDSVFGTVETVTATGGQAPDPAHTSVALTGDGHVVIAVHSYRPGGSGCRKITLIKRTPGASGTWSQETPFDGREPAAAGSLDPASDRYVLTWVRQPACTGDQYLPLSAGFGNAGSTFDPNSAVELPGQTAGDRARDPAVAMDNAGNAVAVWTMDTVGPSTPHAAAFEDGSSPPPPPPPPPNSNNNGNSNPGGNGNPDQGEVPPGLVTLDSSGGYELVNSIPPGVRVRITCLPGIEICHAQVVGTVRVTSPGHARVMATKSKTKSFKLPTVKASISPAQSKQITVSFTKAARRAAQAAFAHGGKVSVTLVVRSGSGPAITRTIKFKRKPKKKH